MSTKPLVNTNQTVHRTFDECLRFGLFVLGKADIDVTNPEIAATSILKCYHSVQVEPGSALEETQNYIGEILEERAASVATRIAQANEMKAEIDASRAKLDAILASLADETREFNPVTQAASPAPQGVKVKAKDVTLTAL